MRASWRRSRAAATRASRYLEWLRWIDPARHPELLTQPNGGFAAVAQQLRSVLAEPRTAAFTDRIAYADLRLRLPEYWNCRVHKMSMAMSVEARAPLQDYQLVVRCFRSGPATSCAPDGKAVFKALRGLVPDRRAHAPQVGLQPADLRLDARPVAPLSRANADPRPRRSGGRLPL